MSITKMVQRYGNLVGFGELWMTSFHWLFPLYRYAARTSYNQYVKNSCKIVYQLRKVCLSFLQHCVAHLVCFLQFNDRLLICKYFLNSSREVFSRSEKPYCFPGRGNGMYDARTKKFLSSIFKVSVDWYLMLQTFLMWWFCRAYHLSISLLVSVVEVLSLCQFR